MKYVLFAVVGAIWGFTIYKYFFYSPDQAAGPVTSATALQPEEKAQQAPQPFQLLEEYRDPFLSRTRSFQPNFEPEAMSSPSPTATSKRAIPIPSKAKDPAPINWKQFRYLGLVEESKGARQIGLLSVSGKLRSVEVGRAYPNLEVLWMNADSIRIRHQEIEKNIGR